MITLLDAYRYKSGHQFLIDTNVWLFLFGPIANRDKKKQEAYAKFIAYLQERKAVIALPAFLFLEISNRLYADIYKAWRYKPENVGKNNSKKDFLPTQDYQDYLVLVRTTFNGMLQIGAPFPDEFHTLDIQKIMRDMATASFADAFFIDYARKKNLIVVSDDGDLKQLVEGSKIELITFRA